MGWLLIIFGVVLIVIAIVLLSRRKRHVFGVPMVEIKHKPKPKPIKKPLPVRKVVEKMPEKRKPSLPQEKSSSDELSPQAIKRIQSRGLNYIDEE